MLGRACSGLGGLRPGVVAATRRPGTCLWRPLLLRPSAAAAMPRRAFSAAPAEHPLDDFFEPPDESDPENMTRYAGRAWKMEELRNKVRRIEPPFCVCVCECERGSARGPLC